MHALPDEKIQTWKVLLKYDFTDTVDLGISVFWTILETVSIRY